jgi:hypothetical protein
VDGARSIHVGDLIRPRIALCAGPPYRVTAVQLQEPRGHSARLVVLAERPPPPDQAEPERVCGPPGWFELAEAVRPSGSS